MRIIKTLVGLIDEELCDAEKYAKLALEHKQDFPELADTFYTLSTEELRHMSLLHNHVVKLIAQHESDPDPRTEGMKIAHQILHERDVEKEKSVRILLEMYR